ncbi:hypothetical protein N7466_003516 [Penicillium verhagenii]|uniref:uncharacterized protein n=1 Tax=Penicillium verhagenii TaxID=1562060 RepID=UPI00254501E2|nr:uncharacterized protein N7466_003516 [Penicillium verhagenii]KAJ5937066.1 hypothetical protein N7466_003516 [Penicillium verhagenii]
MDQHIWRFEGAVITVCGTRYYRNQQCESCIKEMGCFHQCVMVPGITGCNNCRYYRRASTCSLNDTATTSNTPAGSSAPSTSSAPGASGAQQGTQSSASTTNRTFRSIVSEAHEAVLRLDEVARSLDERRRNLQDALGAEHPEVRLLDDDIRSLRNIIADMRSSRL